MVRIIKSNKTVWYNHGDILQSIGDRLQGTDDAEYTYTVAHTTKKTYTLRCNHYDEPRCGLIRLPNTKVIRCNMEIESELNMYRKVQDMVAQIDGMSNREHDQMVLAYIIGKMHYKALCREYGIKHYDKSKSSNNCATGVATFWVLKNFDDPKYVYNRVMSMCSSKKHRQERLQRQLELQEQLEAAAEADRIHSRYEILDL